MTDVLNLGQVDEVVSGAEFARRIGELVREDPPSRQAISKAVKAGRIWTDDKGRLRWPSAARSYLSTSQYTLKPGVGFDSITGAVVIAGEGDAVKPDSPDEEPRLVSQAGAPSEDDRPQLAEASETERGGPRKDDIGTWRQRGEKEKALLAEMERRKKAGELVAVEDVERTMENSNALVRAAVMAVAPRISAELAAETDPHTVKIMLTDALRESLESVTVQLESDTDELEVDEA
ncbi:hypothetical protein KQI63_09760 [bacterium]|nr:hypothetical protein [bacterium]